MSPTPSAAHPSPPPLNASEQPPPVLAPRPRDRLLVPGRPDLQKCDNKVVSARYTALSFLPVAITEQFRRFANMYFLIVGFIMFVGWYSDYYDSAVSPWTTLGPLALVVSVSLLVEGNADWKRHRNDMETNNAPCVILRRAEELDNDEKAERDINTLKGRDVIVNINKAYFTQKSTVQSSDNANSNNNNDDRPSTHLIKVAFQKVRRMDIRQGHFVLVKNREMVPADIVLLASSNDGGSAYIETSSIDGETNLKLRNSPHLPASVLKHLREGTPLSAIDEEEGGTPADPNQSTIGHESIETAVKRLTRFSALGRPTGVSVLDNPDYHGELPNQHCTDSTDRPSSFFRTSVIRGALTRVSNPSAPHSNAHLNATNGDSPKQHYVASLVTEPPNPSVHTFSGKLTLPPGEGTSECYDIPLGADNVLLRGAVLRNTEWCIGLAFFTGNDTKLVMNSFDTPSKFSQLDRLMNGIVLAVLCIMVCCIVYLSTAAVLKQNEEFDTLWYIGYNKDTAQVWPYLPNLDPPEWETNTQNWAQLFFLNVTLLNNFIPLSLYVTIEVITFCMLAFVYVDLDMYDDTTNTRAVARSTIVTDLGRIQYIFSDKTGTLTQNVMRFKRCSVDGMVFGAPIKKARPGATPAYNTAPSRDDDDDDRPTPFHPLRQLLVGQLKRPSYHNSAPGLEGLGGTTVDSLTIDNFSLNPTKLTFNAEMFLRVLSLCHTVVVEKDIDSKDTIDSSMSVSSVSKSGGMFGRSRRRTNTGGSTGSDSGGGGGGGNMTPSGKVIGGRINALQSPLSVVSEDEAYTDSGRNRDRAISSGSALPGAIDFEKGPDGAPMGYAYQAESPDEWALVSAASKTYGFQLIARDSSGIRLRTTAPSHFQDRQLVMDIKTKSRSLSRLAAETASTIDISSAGAEPSDFPDPSTFGLHREETWTIHAVNKFDSERKRMSILLRSPPELGGLYVLFCKGADSAMLLPGVCEGSDMVHGGNPTDTHPESLVLTSLSEAKSEDDDGVDENGWEMAQMLGIQAHLGDFASEGLRTLVLGIRVLPEDEANEWLDSHKAAASSIENREALLTEVALKIEQNLHIVGATAIEDKLQTNVPETIATLGKAGIKLWVLTGDKRETAVEIGYATQVLSPKMHVTEVPDNGKLHVRTQLAMEFMRLVKKGKLSEYQNSVLADGQTKTFKAWRVELFFTLGKCLRSLYRSFLFVTIGLLSVFGLKARLAKRKAELKNSQKEEVKILREVENRKAVRQKAEAVIEEWLNSEEGQQHRKKHHIKPGSDGDISLASEEPPAVFNRASSAKSMLKDLRSSGNMNSTEMRKLSIAALTVQQAGNDEEPFVDEDLLSLDSFFPGANKGDLRGEFDKRKRGIFERLFAIDREVRKGYLKKHMTSERRLELMNAQHQQGSTRHLKIEAEATDGPRGLVIEGAALKHLLGDPLLEQILFGVADQCGSVIACRVSPQQKALLVNLVRHNVKPEPITLAIGDGANDVGMIQEAHVGVGISGKEGRQAVNASDFSIAQFRFLEQLVLIHGRWNFFRLSTVVLFSFYKNALMAGCLIMYAPRTMYSGTPLFDEWIIAMLNFVAGFPIVATGLFDRCLSKDYVREHPEVYKATRDNELITTRTLLRWIVTVFVHLFTMYLFSVPQQSFGGGITPAFQGLMRNEPKDAPGNGEGGDLKSVGTVTFTIMIIILTYKVLYETRSLVHGRWPAFTCRKDVGEGWASRLAYTWVSVSYLSVGFYLFAISTYQLIGRFSINDLSGFTDVVNHILFTRSLSWMLIFFVPIFAMVFDVTAKVFSNMYYPTQTQIHLEIESTGKMEARQRRFAATGRYSRTRAERQQQHETA